jgi:hypothetical protein
LEESESGIGGWSADSKSVFIFKHRGDSYGIFKRDLDSYAEETIVAKASGGFGQDAKLSPDGKWILFRVFPIPEGVFAPHPLVRVPVAGGTPELITTVPRFSGVFCAKAPSNLCVLAEPDKNEKQMLVTAFDPVKGRGPELLRYDLDPFTYAEGIPLFDVSPDGTRFAVAKHTNGPIEILSLSGKVLQVIQVKDLSDIGVMGWTSDGKGLFVCDVNKAGVQFLHVGLPGDAEVLWTSSEGNFDCGWSASDDGRHLALFVVKQSGHNIWMMENF